jgi:EAL domain-containing protein (putative c-di-GMP-specific phosphodiesterase class I)
MDHDDITHYTLELDICEREAALGHRHAVALLRSEFALALNASYFIALSADDITVGAVSRSIPRAGVARYVVVLELVERDPAMTDEQADELLRREFQRAQNASYFLRACREDFAVGLVARERVSAQADLRAA